jgi:hypothetical protein
LAGLARTLLSLGDLAWEQSKLPLAQARYEEAVAIAQQIGNLRMQASALNSLGALLWLRDDLATATQHLSAALELWRMLRNNYTQQYG